MNCDWLQILQKINNYFGRSMKIENYDLEAVEWICFFIIKAFFAFIWGQPKRWNLASLDQMRNDLHLYLKVKAQLLFDIYVVSFHFFLMVFLWDM